LCALSFLRANADLYGIDPDRIAVTGYSAGAHLSALIGVAYDSPTHQPDCEWGPTTAPAAVIPGDVVYEFTAKDSGWIAEFVGGSYDEVPENYRNASPLHNVKAGAPPFLIIHGSDDVVPIDTARLFVTALRDVGTDVRMLELGGAGHVTSAVTATDGLYLQAATDTPEAWAITLDFLARTTGQP
jgi:acetyl esterase/lipase